MGPGTVLGGRYTVHKRLEQIRDTERWSADDGTLGRSVALLTVGAQDPRTPGLLDAARRAASVTQSTFVRILDVGSDGDVAFVVEEDLRDARTLGALVHDGGLPADEVRRITGEVAAALESARARGMHHLDLTPDDVLRTPEGDIRLRGLEVAAARAGEEAADPEDAARRDAVGVVALAYAGLTGLWPLGAGGSGLGPAPRVPGGVAAPSEIAAGVPRDLDALCRLTINHDQGPLSPGDYARQVAPWSSRQVIGRPVTPMAPVPQEEPTRVPGGPAAMPDDAAVPPSPARSEPGGPSSAAPPPGESGPAVPAANGAVPTPVSNGSAPTAEVPAAPIATPAGATAAGGSPATGDTESADLAPATERRRPGLAELAGLVGAGAAAVRARAGSLTDRVTERLPSPTEGREPPARPQPSQGEAGGRGDAIPWLSPAPHAPDRSSAATGGDNGAAAPHRPMEPTEPAEPAGRDEAESDEAGLDEAGSDEAEQSSELVPAPELRPAPTAGHPGEDARGAGGVATSGAVAGVLGTVGERVTHYARRAVDKVSELSPDTQRATPDPAADRESMPVMIPADPLTRDESKLALAIVAGFVILALVVGLYGVSRIGQGSSDIFGPAAAPVTRTTTITPSSSGPASASGTATDQSAAPIEPLAIQEVQAYDPEGDGYEHDELVGTLTDGDPASGWYTESYSSSEFGGIKNGVGLIVDVGTNATPREVRLQIPNQSGLEVWVNSAASLDGATKIGEKDPATGEVEFTVPDDVEGQYVILWYTKVYPDSQGGIRGTLNEVTVLG